MDNKIYRNPSDERVVIPVRGFEIRLEPWTQGELKVVKGCGKKDGLCLCITTIREEDHEHYSL